MRTILCRKSYIVIFVKPSKISHTIELYRELIFFQMFKFHILRRDPRNHHMFHYNSLGGHWSFWTPNHAHNHNARVDAINKGRGNNCIRESSDAAFLSLLQLLGSATCCHIIAPRWYVANISIIFDAPCLFYTNCYIFCLHFVAFLCIFLELTY
jgi:hypothetical protein